LLLLFIREEVLKVLTRRLLAISLMVIFLLTLAAPAFASTGTTNYQRYFDVDGDISMKIQAGSDYSDAGKHQSIAEGVGRLERYDFISMGGGKLEVENLSDWKADQDSLRGLEVASSFWLNDDKDQENDAATLVYEEESKQVFAVSVDADRGEEGHLSQEISSGDSFEIEQKAGTTDGTLKRYIDLVDPDSGEYLFEDTEIKGYAVVVDQLGKNDDEAEEIEVFQFSNPDSNNPDDDAGEGEETPGTFEANQEKETRDSILKLAGGELFEKEVALGTKVEDIGLPESIELTTDMFKITGIEIDWNPALIEDFDPEVEGTYVFIGELVFPENVVVPEPVIVDFTVTVTEDEKDSEEDGDDSGEKEEEEKEPVTENKDDKKEADDDDDDDDNEEDKENGEDSPDENDQD